MPKVPEKGKKPSWAIEVDDADVSLAMALLQDLKLPRPPRLKTQTLAQSVGLIDTPTAERLRQLEAQEGDLEDSLETIDGVASASVELVVPPPPRPGQTVLPSKASVLLRVQPAAQEKMQMQRAELRALVAGAVDGLKADDVMLVIDPVLARAAPAKSDPKVSMRTLIAVLGVTLTLVAGLVVWLGWRMGRRQRNPESATSVAMLAASPSRKAVVAS